MYYSVDDPVVSECMDGDIRLTGGPTPQEGTVEVCMGSVWGGICDAYWSSRAADVACSQLGHRPHGMRNVGD